MKIIGQQGSSTILISMSRTEYARLIGLSYESQLKDEHLDTRDRELVPRIEQIASLEGLPSQVTQLESILDSLGTTAKKARALVDSTKFTPIKAHKPQ